jgi:hypothetical protein
LEHKSWSIESIVDHFTVQCAAVSRFQFNIKHYREKAADRRTQMCGIHGATARQIYGSIHLQS